MQIEICFVHNMRKELKLVLGNHIRICNSGISKTTKYLVNCCFELKMNGEELQVKLSFILQEHEQYDKCLDLRGLP